MKVEIWSDVMCPFCYIGKRRFEEALSHFDHQDEVQVEWKSFQLNPLLKTDTSISVYQSLADSKGWQPEYARQVTEQVTELAAQVGLTYNFDFAVVANSFNAHRLSQLAKKHNLSDAAEEQLFRAYFTDGKNIDDQDTLLDIGLRIGLDAEEVKQALQSDAYTNAVHQDIYEAETLNIRGVPFFVLDDKYAVSGAQPAEVFLNTLQTAYLDQQQETTTSATEGPACDADGNCE
ncbi:DsbA family oxidoreductase [Mucilaginibacter robiniae]|uniref:DsbA family oxidoreductase n=1 Tax=Mucilaginibacter robiniae TaxID=2728022 RepID=A0A7L5DYE1_9SPHI|nr:DsbA family oxidoreductase [Mucilaginibacter robiniae]QJD95127.1 DsbA family oxidoreductase [Mucilaginibacter robiniae]